MIQTQKGRFWVTQLHRSLTVTSTTERHGYHSTARSHLHPQRTHDDPSVSYCSTVRGDALALARPKGLRYALEAGAGLKV